MNRRIVFILSAVAWTAIQAAEYSASFYEIGSNRSKKLYSFQSQSTEADGVTTQNFVTKDLEGKDVVVEKGQIRGDQLIKYEMDHRQLNAKATIEIKGEEILFTETRDGKTKTDSEKKKGDVLVSANFVPYIQKNWDKLKAGEALDIRYAVWDRRETVGFTFMKIGEEKVGDKNALVFRMKPTSFVIAALVDPLILKFSEADKKLLELKGRVQAKNKVGEKWKDLDAEVIYSYP